MADDKRPSLLANEQNVHLLREVVKWRRANGWDFFQWRPGKGFGAFSEWKKYESKEISHNVSYEPDGPRLLATHDYYGGQLEPLPVSTVTEAVDVLVAFGYLPLRFSSAYRAGWEARADATDADGALDLITWPELAPAVEAAW